MYEEITGCKHQMTVLSHSQVSPSILAGAITYAGFLFLPGCSCYQQSRDEARVRRSQRPITCSLATRYNHQLTAKHGQADLIEELESSV